MKRTLDLLAAVIGSLLFLPFLAVAAIAIKLDSRGPVFYLGPRIGRGGQPFQIYKLRTMVANADRVGPPLASVDDPRITRVGGFLRRTRLDRVPELINVLRGEMSLVGPSPEDPAYVEVYTPEQRLALSVRPGMTGPASLAYADEERLLASGRGLASYAETILPVKLELDLDYVRRASFAEDLWILARSIGLPTNHLLVRFRRLARSRHSWRPWAVIDGPIIAAAYAVALAVHWLDVPGARPGTDLGRLLLLIPVLVAIYLAANGIWGLHRRIWRHSLTPEVVPVFVAAASGTVVAIALNLVLSVWSASLPLAVVLLGGFFTFCGLVGVRYGWRIIRSSYRSGPLRSQPRTRTLIYGAGENGQLLAWRLLSQTEGQAYELVGFLDDDRAKLGLRIHGVEVLGDRQALAAIVVREQAELIILAIANLGGERLRAIVSASQETTAQIKISQGLFDWMKPGKVAPLLREVRLEDLLSRRAASLDAQACAAVVAGRTVLVTGAAGSIGWELCQQMAGCGPQQLLVLDNNESGVYDLVGDLRTRFPALSMQAVVADVTDETRIRRIFAETRPEAVFHVAAYKHVPLMEEYPEEAVRVNIGGTITLLRCACEHRAERFVLVSTDKAVNPTSVMGATKRVAEALVASPPGQETLCTAVRFGNVLGSRGSVVPTFARQIEQGGPVTVTHPQMTRFFMDISEAASLIIQAASLTQGGDVYMLDMGDHIRIEDLARKMIRMRGLRPEIDIPIVYTGVRPGEKLHEELAHEREELVATDHPLIHRVGRVAGEGAVRGADVGEAAERLLRLAAAGRRQELVGELLSVCDRLGSRPRPRPDDAPAPVAAVPVHPAGTKSGRVEKGLGQTPDVTGHLGWFQVSPSRSRNKVR